MIYSPHPRLRRMTKVLQDRRKSSGDVNSRRASGWVGPGRPICSGGGLLRPEVVAKWVEELRDAGERDVLGRDTMIPGRGTRCEAGCEFTVEALCRRDSECQFTVRVQGHSQEHFHIKRLPWKLRRDEVPTSFSATAMELSSEDAR